MKPCETVGKATWRACCTSPRPATRRPLQPRPRRPLPRRRAICARDLTRPTLAAAACQACPSRSRALPSSVRSPLSDDDAETTFHALPALVRPMVTMPPPEAASPSIVWRRVTAWVALPASALSLISASPWVELRRNSERLLDSHARAASLALEPWTVAPSVPPERTSDEGVPNWFHATWAPRSRTSLRCAAVGASLPARTSRSGRPLGLPWMSVSAAADPASASVPIRAQASTKPRCERICDPLPRMDVAARGPVAAVRIEPLPPLVVNGRRQAVSERRPRGFKRSAGRHGPRPPRHLHAVGLVEHDLAQAH